VDWGISETANTLFSSVVWQLLFRWQQLRTGPAKG